MIVRIFFVFFLVSACAVSAEARAVRGVWVRPFVGADKATRSDPFKGREFIRAELRRLERAGLNTVYVEAFWNGYAMYPSKIALSRPLSIPYGFALDEKGWDVLNTYIEEGEKLNLKIHAWVHVFYQWNSSLGAPEKSPIFSEHPEWMMLDANGSPHVTSEAEGAGRDIYKVFMSPSNPGAKKYLRAVVSELASNYPKLGGIQWDYVRYPLHSLQQTFDYSPDAAARFKRDTGLEAKKLSPENTPREWRTWKQWKTRQVSDVVKELTALVREKRPEWEISAAVFPDFEENLRLKMQDSLGWARSGLVDALLPMLYSPDYSRVENWAREFKSLLPAKTKIYPALLVSQFYDSRSKRLDCRYLMLRAKLGLEGFGVFAAQNLDENLIEQLREN